MDDSGRRSWPETAALYHSLSVWNLTLKPNKQANNQDFLCAQTMTQRSPETRQKKPKSENNNLAASVQEEQGAACEIHLAGFGTQQGGGASLTELHLLLEFSAKVPT